MSATLTVVPAGSPAGFTPTSLPPANSTRVPSASASSRVSSSSRDTAAMDGRASPRKPRVAIDSKSSAVLSLLVACRSKASSASSCVIPWPSSVTRIMRLPPCSTSIRTVFAPASRAFSSSSFTTDAGRSTTSPAAILFATASASMRIRDISWPCEAPPCGDNARTRISFRSFFLLLDGEIEIVELRGVDFTGRIGHQILRGGSLGEGNDFADALLASKKHHDAVDAERDPAVRRRAVGQRVEKEAEAAAKLFFGQAERFEEPLLNILPVNSNAARAKLVAVQHEVIALRTHF